MSRLWKGIVSGALGTGLAAALWFAEGSSARPPEAPKVPPAGMVDLAPRAIMPIPVGTVVAPGKVPKDWTNIVLHATPTLTEEDLKNAPAMAAKFARMFKYTILANVTKSPGAKRYTLEKVAQGFAVESTGGNEVVVDGQNAKGTDLGMFGRQILDENEKILTEEVRQVVRTNTTMVFDAKCVMLRKGEHEPMVLRHAVVVDPATGALRCAVWLMTKDYEPAEDAFQMLAPNAEEKRLLSVKKDEFRLGIPTRKAFALRGVPAGTPIAFTPALKEVAFAKKFTAEAAAALERDLVGALKW